MNSKHLSRLAVAILSLSLFAACASAKKKADVITVSDTAHQQTQAAKAKVDAAATGTATCKNEGDERKLEVAKDGEGCKLKYTKMGKTTDAATSANGLKHCEDVLAKIRKHLTKAGFSCE